MMKGTFPTFNKLMNRHFRQCSLGIFALMSSVVFSTSLMAGEHSRDSDHDCDRDHKKCECIKGQKGPQGDVGPAGLAGHNSFDGLANYASFQLLIPQSGMTTAIAAGQNIPFGDLVTGTSGPNDPINGVINNSAFQLSKGFYKISVGVSLFGPLNARVGQQLEVNIDGITQYFWPAYPTVATDNESFIQLIFLLEVTSAQSVLVFKVNNAIPASAIDVPVSPPAPSPYIDLQNYLTIERIADAP